MEEYKYKLKAAFSRYLKQFLKDNPSWNIRGFNVEILKVEKVYPNLDKVKVKPHILLSGDPTSIEIQGSVFVEHSIEHGSRNRSIKFWAQDTVVQFDNENEEFIIIELNKFIPIDLN